MESVIKDYEVTKMVWFCFLSNDEQINVLYPVHNTNKKLGYYKLHLN